MAKKTHKGQHFVPACYLKAWCDPACPPNREPYVWLFDKDGSNPRNKAPSNIFKETDMYTITGMDGSRDLSLEDGLSGLESMFTRVRKMKLDKMLSLTDDEHTCLAAFVAAGQLRTVRSRDHHAKQWGRAVEIGDDLERTMKNASPERRRAMGSMSTLDSGGPSMTLDDVRQLAATPVQKMIGPILRTTIPVLKRMNMAVLFTEDPIGFITSDAPVTWYDPEAYKYPPMYRSVGLGCKTIEVTMPLSPQQCLIFSWHPLAGYVKASKQFLDVYNHRHRAFCNEHFVVKQNRKEDAWFVNVEPPEDSWEKKQEHKTRGSNE
jgi:hypothetical protein